MELLQLQYFMEVAKCEHITKAAENLAVAQPALTQSIHRLESELETKLFERTGRNIKLNKAGKVLYNKLIPILASLDNIKKELSTLQDSETKTIRINILAASILVTKIIMEYRKLHPEVDFKLMQNHKDSVCDFRISTSLNAVAKSSLDIIFNEPILLAVPSRSALALKKSVTLNELEKEDFISLTESPFRSICDQFCKQAKFTPHIVFESDNPGTVRDLISANFGIGFWPLYSWGKLNNENVILMPVADVNCKRDILVSSKQKFEDNSYLADFYAFFISKMREQRKSNIILI